MRKGGGIRCRCNLCVRCYIIMGIVCRKKVGEEGGMGMGGGWGSRGGE